MDEILIEMLNADAFQNNDKDHIFTLIAHLLNYCDGRIL